MQRNVITTWQRSWGTALALLALLAWCMPTIAMGCAVMPSVALLHCSEMNPDAAEMQQMPCCHKIPLPQSQSSHSHYAVLSTDGHLPIPSVAYPPSHAPLWALLIVSTDLDVDVKVVFPPKNFSPPSVVYAVSQLAGRAPPSLI